MQLDQDLGQKEEEKKSRVEKAQKEAKIRPKISVKAKSTPAQAVNGMHRK